jgi:hypothetical protein
VSEDIPSEAMIAFVALAEDVTGRKSEYFLHYALMHDEDMVLPEIAAYLGGKLRSRRRLIEQLEHIDRVQQRLSGACKDVFADAHSDMRSPKNLVDDMMQRLKDLCARYKIIPAMPEDFFFDLRRHLNPPQAGARPH